MLLESRMGLSEATGFLFGIIKPSCNFVGGFMSVSDQQGEKVRE